MKALIVYESMYGNTHVVASEIAAALRPTFEVTLVPVKDATQELVSACDFLVCGGPTHAHGMSGGLTRRAAIDAAHKPDSHLDVDDAAAGPGLREWFNNIAHRHVAAAAFDTRVDGAAALTGRASLGIARRLRRHGYALIAPPESFLVDKNNHLLPGELEHAAAWAATLIGAAVEQPQVG
jgi:hypothetical protein